MTARWEDPNGYPARHPMTTGGLVRVCVLGPLLLVLNFGSLVLLLLLRLIERPIFGEHRPWTPYIVQFVCRNSLRLLRIRLSVNGQPMRQHGAIVANHSSWLDIYVLNARKRVYFVSKAEVSGWFGIGALARATGTVFIERARKHAAAQRDLMKVRLGFGHKLLFFPEGTSTNGRLVLPFKPTLFEALFEIGDADLFVQPVAVEYRAPNGEDPRFYGWWGELDFAPHMLSIFAARAGGQVTIHYLEPLRVSDFRDRKALAAACHAAVSGALQTAIAGAST